MLTLLVLSCVVPASFMAAVLIYHSYEREKSQLVRDSMATARALTLAVDRDLASVKAALLTLATSPHLASDDLAAFYAQAKEVLREQNGNNIVLSDARGQQRINTLRTFGEPLPPHGNMGQLRKVFATGQPVVSDLYIGAVARRPLVGIDVPVRRGDAIVYDISMGMFPERLSTILSEQRLPSDWVLSIFDSTGTMVSRTHQMERFVGQKGAPALIRRMAEVAEDSLETNTVEGLPVLAVFSRSAVSNWTVAIGIPRANLDSDLWHSIRWMILVMAVLLASSLGLASTVGGRIIRAFRGLSGPALALGYGELVQVPSLGLQEADEVGNAMAKASVMLRQAQYSAQHDPLTGLANRALFDEMLKQQLAICQRTATELAILYIDLDDFKAVNDRYGHAVGDGLLRAVATRLQTGSRHADIAARLGGDEFAIALNQTGAQDAAIVAGKFVESLSAPYQIDSLQIDISASIGVSVYPDTGSTHEALLHGADKAMYEAKALGKRGYVVTAH